MTGQHVREVLQAHFPAEEDQRYAVEYIDEAEHQDGEGYWEQFITDADLIIDFTSYLYIAREDQFEEEE